MKKAFLQLLLILAGAGTSAQTIQKLSEHFKVSIRGLSVVDDQIIWVSGSEGSVGRSTDGGKSWEWTSVPGFEKRDFRDIEAFDDKTAIIIAVAEPANILRTADGGKSWKTVFTDTTKGMFLDAMDFAPNGMDGVVVGDPIRQKLFMARTKDSGQTWIQEPLNMELQVEEGEAMFAASGSNIKLYPSREKNGFNTLIVTGGKKSRLFVNNKGIDLPIVEGKESTGANGLDLWSNQFGVIVGGDFSRDSASLKNCVLFQLDKEIHLNTPTSPPHGYRSSVSFIDARRLVACGTTGIDISSDGGLNWKLISPEAYHVCKKAKKGNAVFLAGPRGRIARLDW